MRLAQTRYPTPPMVPAASAYARLVDSWTVHIHQWQTAGVPAELARLKRSGAVSSILLYDNAVPIIDLHGARLRSQPWQVWRTNWNASTRHAGLDGTLSWCTEITADAVPRRG